MALMVLCSMKYRVEAGTVSVLFNSLHAALKYFNTVHFARLYESSSGRLVDVSADFSRRQSQVLYSYARDKLNLEHESVQNILNLGGPLLEDQLLLALNRQELLYQREQGTAYARAVLDFYGKMIETRLPAD